MSEKESEQREAAQKAWDEWHDLAGFVDDDVPMMPPLWEVAFAWGVRWAASLK